MALLCAIASAAFAADTVPVMKGQFGLFVAEEASVATGFSVEKALASVLTSAQLDRFVLYGEKVLPLDKTTTFIGWDSSYTHRVYEDKATWYAVLDGAVIRSVEETTTETRVEFNHFFIAAALYVVVLWAMYWLPRGRKDTALFLVGLATVAAGVAAGVAASVITAAAVAVATTTAAVAIIAVATTTVVVAAVVAAVDWARVRSAAIAGTVAMAVEALVMFYN